jgi:hypothetical protein
MIIPDISSPTRSGIPNHTLSTQQVFCILAHALHYQK